MLALQLWPSWLESYLKQGSNDSCIVARLYFASYGCLICWCLNFPQKSILRWKARSENLRRKMIIEGTESSIKSILLLGVCLFCCYNMIWCIIRTHVASTWIYTNFSTLTWLTAGKERVSLTLVPDVPVSVMINTVALDENSSTVWSLGWKKQQKTKMHTLWSVLQKFKNCHFYVFCV